MLAFLLNLLRTPSGFDADPWGFARNQALHGLIFGVSPVLLGVPWWVAATVYWFAIEQVQVDYFDGDLWDGFEDAAFVTTAAAATAYLFWPGAVLFALFFAAGFCRRKKDRDIIRGLF